jgi:hypothetical protein
MEFYELNIGKRKCVIHYITDANEMAERINSLETILEIYYFPLEGEKITHEQLKSVFEHNEADILLTVQNVVNSDIYNFLPIKGFFGSVAGNTPYVDYINAGYVAA